MGGASCQPYRVKTDYEETLSASHSLKARIQCCAEENLRTLGILGNMFPVQLKGKLREGQVWVLVYLDIKIGLICLKT